VIHDVHTAEPFYLDGRRRRLSRRRRRRPDRRGPHRGRRDGDRERPFHREDFHARIIAQGAAAREPFDFQQFLGQIDKNVPSDLSVHVVLDNLSTHKTAAARRWFARHPRFQVHFTPTYSSWLNQVERWFGLLEQKQLKRSSHRNVAELEKAIYEFIDVSNDAPKPFVWTKSADDILTSLGRFCGTTLASQG
jgi:transposase